MRWWMLTIAPLILQFSRWSNCHPLRHSRIGARLKKPSRLAFSYASRSTGGEKAFGKSTYFSLIRQFSRWSNCHLPQGEGDYAGFPWGKLSARTAVSDD